MELATVNGTKNPVHHNATTMSAMLFQLTSTMLHSIIKSGDYEILHESGKCAIKLAQYQKHYLFELRLIFSFSIPFIFKLMMFIYIHISLECHPNQ